MEIEARPERALGEGQLRELGVGEHHRRGVRGRLPGEPGGRAHDPRGDRGALRGRLQLLQQAGDLVSGAPGRGEGLAHGPEQRVVESGNLWDDGADCRNRGLDVVERGDEVPDPLLRGGDVDRSGQIAGEGGDVGPGAVEVPLDLGGVELHLLDLPRRRGDRGEHGLEQVLLETGPREPHCFPEECRLEILHSGSASSVRP